MACQDCEKWLLLTNGIYIRAQDIETFHEKYVVDSWMVHIVTKSGQSLTHNGRINDLLNAIYNIDPHYVYKYGEYYTISFKTKKVILESDLEIKCEASSNAFKEKCVYCDK